MKYLKSYEIFESAENMTAIYQHLESELRDFFLPVNDMTHVIVAPRYGSFSRFSYGQVQIVAPLGVVTIGLSHRITPDESGESKWGVKYKELIKGDLIAEEVANSISICMGMGFRVVRAEIAWVNAGEWKLSNPDKEGTGPGLLTKIFEKGGIVGPMDMVDSKVTKARYSPEILPDFII